MVFPKGSRWNKGSGDYGKEDSKKQSTADGRGHCCSEKDEQCESKMAKDTFKLDLGGQIDVSKGGCFLFVGWILNPTTKSSECEAELERRRTTRHDVSSSLSRAKFCFKVAVELARDEKVRESGRRMSLEHLVFYSHEDEHWCVTLYVIFMSVDEHSK